MTVPSPKIRLKTDSHSLVDKCVLRRTVIKAAGFESLRVLDLFAGEGNIWNELRRQSRDPEAPSPLNIEKYVPIDMAARQAGILRFKITPRLIASLNGDTKPDEYTGTDLSRYNVIDIDCYGDPWPLWEAVLFRIKKPTCVFLTRGKVTYGAGRMPISNHAKKVLGIPDDWNVPGKIELLDHADRCQLLEPCPTAKIDFGYEMMFPRVSYYGLHAIPT